MLTIQNTGRQAITTRYIGPSNFKGSRIVARCEAGRKYVGYESRLNSAENHANAVRELCQKLGWQGNWVGGGTDNGYVFVDIAGSWASEGKA